PGLYPIPDDYQIEVFWGCSEKNHVQVSINYIERIPHFKIEWIHDMREYEHFLEYLQLYEELTKTVPKTNQSRYIKPLSDISNSLYRKKIKIATENLFNDFETEKNKIWHSLNNPKLKEIVLEAGEQPWLVKFEEDQQLEKKKAQKVVQAINHSNISRRGYRALTTTSQDLPKEWLLQTSNSDPNNENSDSNSEDNNSDSEDSDLDS
ncbi:16414_t:CDS:2, partial [Dentiscutata heterogama]